MTQRPAIARQLTTDFNDEVTGLIHGYFFQPQAKPQRLAPHQVRDVYQQCDPEHSFVM